MDLANLAPELAKMLGLQPSTLVLLFVLATMLCNVVSRTIPADATGALGIVRKVATIIAANPAKRLNSEGVTVTDVAQASLTTPPIDKKAKAEAEG